MKISFQWLNEFISMEPFFEDPSRLVSLLAQGGLEAENLEDHRGRYQNICVGKIVRKEPHPNAQRLTLCEVEVGPTGRPALSIICGANNHTAGDKVVVALPGATLPSGMVMKETKIRGVSSSGMLCSYEELGLAEEEGSRSQEGGSGGGGGSIIILPPTAPLGKNFGELSGREDVVCELKVTPNRGDCLSHYGLARELAVLLKREWKGDLLFRDRLPLPLSSSQPPAQLQRQPQPEVKEPPSVKSMKVELKAEDLCACYFGQVLYDVQVGPSPLWLKSRLNLLGLHSINNVVDITNYVLHGLGQPLHAFDISRLQGDTLWVDRASAGETFLALNDISYVLQGSELTIRDRGGAVALAGLIGGKETAISPHTQTLFLESACFSPQGLRSSTSLHRLQTDSSYRFARGVDPELAGPALNYAISLLKELCGAKLVSSPSCAVFSRKHPRPQHGTVKPISVQLATLEERLGYEVKEKDFKEAMVRLGCKCEKAKKTKQTKQAKQNPSYEVTIPSYRQMDLKIEMDLVEEYARLYGYHFIKESLPPLVEKPAKHDRDFMRDLRVTSLLQGKGFCRVHNFYLTSGEEQKKYSFPSFKGEGTEGTPVPILNPLSSAQDTLRQSLFPGLLANLKTNKGYQIKQGDLFEIGPVFFHQGPSVEGSSSFVATASSVEDSVSVSASISSVEDSASFAALPIEKTHLALMSWGVRESWWPRESKPLPTVFYLKALLENLFEQLGLKDLHWKQEGAFPSFLHTGQCVHLWHGHSLLGFLGSLHPVLCRKHKLMDGEVAFAELDLSCLSWFAMPDFTLVRGFSRQPKVVRDLCLVLSQELAIGKVIGEIQSRMGDVLKKVEVFDIYQDKELAAQKKKSVAFHLLYQGKDETLKEKQINELQETLLSHLQQKFQAEIRQTPSSLK